MSIVLDKLKVERIKTILRWEPSEGELYTKRVVSCDALGKWLRRYSGIQCMCVYACAAQHLSFTIYRYILYINMRRYIISLGELHTQNIADVLNGKMGECETLLMIVIK